MGGGFLVFDAGVKGRLVGEDELTLLPTPNPPPPSLYLVLYGLRDVETNNRPSIFTSACFALNSSVRM